jgi:hypothetical protein
MNTLKGVDANVQISILHNVKVVQSRKGWTRAEAEKAITDAKAGIACPKGEKPK